MPADECDLDAVRALLGREPQAPFDVVVRDGGGQPVVIRNAPRLDDGTPMPTRYWLVGPREVLAVSRLESEGGVRRAEAAIDPAAIADAHRRYGAERDAVIDGVDDPGVNSPPRASGGVGGTSHGVKCLHAHYAWYLAGGDDPVGRWVADRLVERLDIDIAPSSVTFRHAGHDTTVPIGPLTLLAGELIDPDPPGPAQLTNALGTITDHLDDVIRDQPTVAAADDVRVAGHEAWHLVVVERGGPVAEVTTTLDRPAAEDVFRLLATERRADRLGNPGLEPARVDSVLGTCCVIVAVMRRLHLERVTVSEPLSASEQIDAVSEPQSTSEQIDAVSEPRSASEQIDAVTAPAGP